MPGYENQEPWDEGYLQVSDLHRVYYAQHGNKNGLPVIFLHGGPGGGTSAKSAEFFDPAHYHIVLMDQRGGGKSRPVAEIRENTTQLLIADIETVREKLQIPKWSMVFGGSWGSTLSLAYAQAHPEAVGSLVLRGVFLGEEWEFDWTLRGHGSAVLFPDRWEDFIQFLPEEKRDDPTKAYHELLVSEDRETALTASKNWNRWEMSISTLLLADDALEKLEDEDWGLQHARIEAHYFVNGCFLRDEKRLLRKENMERIAHIPTYIVQGRYDVVCPPKAAWLVHKALPQSKLQWSPDAGHSATEPGTEILTVGAGVGGPAAAYGLSKIPGCTVTVVENSQDLRSTGQQVDLRGQGIVVMKMMGIDKAVRACLCAEPGTRMIDSKGRSQAYVPANASGEGRQTMTSEYEIMRGDLANILYEETKDRGNVTDAANASGVNGWATSSALIQAYVLAGEISKRWEACQNPGETLNFHDAAQEFEHIIRPIIRDTPSFLLRLGLPETRLGIRVLQTFSWLVRALKIAAIIDLFFPSEVQQKLEFPDYFGLRSQYGL